MTQQWCRRCWCCCCSSSCFSCIVVVFSCIVLVVVLVVAVLVVGVFVLILLEHLKLKLFYVEMDVPWPFLEKLIPAVCLIISHSSRMSKLVCTRLCHFYALYCIRYIYIYYIHSYYAIWIDMVHVSFFFACQLHHDWPLKVIRCPQVLLRSRDRTTAALTVASRRRYWEIVVFLAVPFQVPSSIAAIRWVHDGSCAFVETLTTDEGVWYGMSISAIGAGLVRPSGFEARIQHAARLKQLGNE